MDSYTPHATPSHTAPKRQNLNDYIVEKIREKILTHQYTPGMKLPNEYALAEEYGVCRYTVREAIKKLLATGLLTVVRGRGTYVNEMIPSAYFKPIIEKLILADQDVAEIFEARIAIEQKTAGLAAQKAKGSEIETMKHMLDNMEEALALNDYTLFNELDIKLHNQIASASRNRILIEIQHILNDLVRYTIEKASINKAKHEVSHKGHQLIVEAIESRDVEKAKKAMSDHLSFCRGLF